jgi:hypothetical protein
MATLYNGPRYLSTGGQQSKVEWRYRVVAAVMAIVSGMLVHALAMDFLERQRIAVVGAEVVEVNRDYEHPSTTYRLEDGLRVREPGIYGKVGDRVALRVYFYSKEIVPR